MPASQNVAEQAFQNIDVPLQTGIERWTKALELAPDNFSAHSSWRNWPSSATNWRWPRSIILKAWRLMPGSKIAYCSTSAGCGKPPERPRKPPPRCWPHLAAASRAPPKPPANCCPRATPGFTNSGSALDLDPSNVELHRELAYLLLRMDRKSEAEEEFKTITQRSPGDLLSAAQLGFLYLARGDRAAALPLLQRVIDGNDRDLANRVRAALQLPQVLSRLRPVRGRQPPRRLRSKPRSWRSAAPRPGYMKDALKYLQIAHESDPVDFDVMLKLGVGVQHAPRRRSGRAVVRAGPARARIRKSRVQASTRFQRAPDGASRACAPRRGCFPFYSTRWHDLFSYGQVKTEVRLGDLPVRPYLSVRLIGDTRSTIGGALPQYLSESSVILAAGLATRYWHGLMAWGEAGSAISYLGRPAAGTCCPIIAAAWHWLAAGASSWDRSEPGGFFETNADGVFVSRFGNDVLMYSQNRLGYTFAPVESLGNFHARSSTGMPM